VEETHTLKLYWPGQSMPTEVRHCRAVVLDNGEVEYVDMSGYRHTARPLAYEVVGDEAE
jgi:hypothetical protein